MRTESVCPRSKLWRSIVLVCGLYLPTQADVSRAASPSPVAWQTIGKSVEGRLVEIAQFGDGGRSYLVVGPLHGDAREAYELIERLAAHLAQGPAQLVGKRIIVLRDPNPDGHVRARPENASGVDLDRNFQSAAWERVSWRTHWVSGRTADSEPETRAVSSLVANMMPARLIQVRVAQRGSISVSGPTEDVAVQISRATNHTLLTIDPAVKNGGSLGQFAAIDRRIPMLTLWAERNLRTPPDREPLFRAMLMALDFEVALPPTATFTPVAVETARPVASAPAGSYPAVTRPAAPPSRAAAVPGEMRVLSVDHLLRGAPLAPVISARAAAARGAAQTSPLAPPVSTAPVSTPPPTATAVPSTTFLPHTPPPAMASTPQIETPAHTAVTMPQRQPVHPAVVTETTERPAPTSMRPPEKPIPITDADLN